jgi:hypothetical protein
VRLITNFFALCTSNLLARAVLALLTRGVELSTTNQGRGKQQPSLGGDLIDLHTPFKG